MDNSSVSDAGGPVSYGALASLFGVKGPFRLVPQSSTPKAHIVIKRDNVKEQSDTGESSSGVARFSFVAGKKFTISKGQPLLFAVASPSDRDGKTLLYDDSTFLLEADLCPSEETSEEDTERPEFDSAQSKGQGNIEGLPPKMRKSYAKKKSYASFIENESPSSLGFLGYPLGAPPARIYSTAAVQTDLHSPSPSPSPIPSSLPEPVTAPCISLPDIRELEKSPVQLPSPVSADHAREPTSDSVAQVEGEETDDFSREERSLSPMDLSSASCSPANSPTQKSQPLPQEPSFDVTKSPSIPTVSTDLPTTNIEPVLEPSSNISASTSPPAAVEKLTPDPAPDQPMDLDIPSCPTPPKSTSPPPQLHEHVAEIEPLTQPKEIPPTIPTDDLIVKKELVLQSEVTPVIQNAVASSSKTFSDRERTAKPQAIPTNPRAMVQAQRNMSNLSLRAQEKSPAQPPTKSSLPTPISMKISTQIRTSSPPPDPKSLAYIPSGSSSNPLGIRPSSISVHPSQKSVPKGPRSLVGPGANTQPPKKPIVVGAKWSAARSSGSSSNAPNGSMSASTSSSSLTSVPSSPAVSASTTTAGLSHILRYASPSPPPPPPPQSDPPPPPLPLPLPLPSQGGGGAKWKRISSVDDKSTNASSKTVSSSQETSRSPVVQKKDLRSTPSSVTNASLKRPYDTLNTGQLEAQDGQVSKRARPSPPPPTPSVLSPSIPASVPALPSLSTASSSAKPPPTHSPVLKTTGGNQKVPLPMTHPLPPKPVATASSYRPAPKRERTPEPSEPKRPLPRTDWPSTSPSATHQLKSNGQAPNLGIQKIVFNSDGTLMAIICADRTLRMWENAQPAAEVARLSHNASIASVCWTQGDTGVMTLTADGMLSTWMRNGKEWTFSKLFVIHDVAISDSPVCMAYHKDRIAVTTAVGVKIWLLINGTWQIQRDLVRSGVTALRFVQDGEALIGGCRDGVLWHCKIPNGNLRVHAFLSIKPIISIDVHPTGAYLLVAQEGGKAHLVTFKPNENKGVIERTYTYDKLQATNQMGFPAVFATKGQAVLYGSVNGCALVWDRKKGLIVYGLKHPEGDPVQAAATFDGRPGVEGLMITGTKQGRLFWWPQPVAAAPTHSGNGAPRRSV